MNIRSWHAVESAVSETTLTARADGHQDLLENMAIWGIPSST